MTFFRGADDRIASGRNKLGTVGAIAGALAAVLALAGCSAGASQHDGTSPSGIVYDDSLPAELPPLSPSLRAPNVVLGEYTDITLEVDKDWATAVAEATGIPYLAVVAYGGAAIFVENQNPDCKISWNMIAGVGEVESHHGMIHDGTIADDGTISPPIFGIPLDGTTTHEVADSDGGEFDGDAQWDRAMGPFQFIPVTWADWAVDASGDGIADPHNIFDAAAAAANSLCNTGIDLSIADNWRMAVAGYNDADHYDNAVSRAAKAYAESADAALAVPTP